MGLAIGGQREEGPCARCGRNPHPQITGDIWAPTVVPLPPTPGLPAGGPGSWESADAPGLGREVGKCLTPPPLLQRKAMAQGRVSAVLGPIFPTVVLFCHLVTSSSWQPHGLRHTRLPCPSPSPGVILLINPLENQGRMKNVIRTPNSHQGSTSVRRN